MEHSLEIKNLTKQYQHFKLDDVSFSLPRGTIMGFIGENGAGKTTTLSLILNLFRRDSGTVKILGLDNIHDEIAIKQQLGVVFDQGYFDELTRIEDIPKIMRRIFKTWDQSLYDSYVTKFRLPSHQPLKEFSRGMKVKLSIATALSHKPKLLLLDEATSGLDPVARAEILDIFLEYISDEENSILFSSHITTDIEKIADYVTFIEQGKIVFSEPKDRILESYGLLKCSAEHATQLDSSLIIGARKGQFGYEALVSDRALVQKKYPHILVEKTDLENILFFYSIKEGV